ncbi:MAG: OmpA family protein [Paracoccaceae bacterium]
MKLGFVPLCLSVTLALAPLAPAIAQSNDASDMSAEQLEQLFLKQKTRGLVIAPNTGKPDAMAETTTATTPTKTTYVELNKDEQVNVRISFDFDSAALREDQKPKLVTLCKVMKSADVNMFRIVGHTDSSGSASYNQKLSLLRAEEVKRYLVNDCGISGDRLQATGVGEDFLFNPDDPRGEENRRVEFQALS